METSTKIKFEKKFEEYRESYIRESKTLINIISLYKHIRQRKADRLNEMNIAPCFFSYVFYSFVSVIIIWSNKLLDPKDSKRNLFNFLKFIKSHHIFFSIEELNRRRNYPNGNWMLIREQVSDDSVQKDIEKISSLRFLSSVKTLRDKYYAHFDKKYFDDPQKMIQDAPFKNEELDELVEMLKEILNKYSSAYDGKIYKFEPLNIYDIDRMLDILHKKDK